MRKKEEKAPLLWLWEFSKKVVTIAFVVYVATFLYSLVMAYSAIQLTADTTALSTIITEFNETFRVVVGGYMLKAGGENVVKITTAYLDKKRQKKEQPDEPEELDEDGIEFLEINDL